jgi:hypothetical protein
MNPNLITKFPDADHPATGLARLAIRFGSFFFRKRIFVPAKPLPLCIQGTGRNQPLLGMPLCVFASNFVPLPRLSGKGQGMGCRVFVVGLFCNNKIMTLLS